MFYSHSLTSTYSNSSLRIEIGISEHASISIRSLDVQ